MRNAAEAILKKYKSFVSIDGTAENTGIADHSEDFVICAQAFHWFDREACKKEFQRILKPNGKVVLVWNKRKVEETGFSVEYEKLVRTYANDYNEVNHNLITEVEFGMFFKKGVYHKAACDNLQIFDFEGLKGRLLSSSYSPMPGEKNYEPLMAELKKLFDRCEVNGSVVFDHVTESYIGEV